MSTESQLSLEQALHLGNQRMSCGDYRGAIAAYAQAIKLAPLESGLHYLLGCAHHENQDRAAAILAYQRALELHPTNADAANNIGIAYQELGQFDLTIQAYQIAVRSNPGLVAAWTNLGIAFQATERLDEALASFRRAYQLAPNNPPTLMAMGSLFIARQKLDEAGECFGLVAQLEPTNAEAFYNLGLVHQSLGNAHFAAHAFGTAADLSTNYSRLLQLNQLQHLNSPEDLEARSAIALRELVQAQQRNSVEPVPPFLVMTLPVEATAETQSQCARYWVQKKFAHIPRLIIRPRPKKERIRLGYISPDFRGHPGAVLIAELLEKHNRNQFEVLAYSLAPPDDTVFRRRIIAGCDRFLDLRADSIAAAAERIAADEVDILVDISGYTLHSRTEILAARPASIQVAYLGFPGTMGADFIDYILVDQYVVPPDQQPYYSEKLVHLPGCYQVNTNQWKLAPTPTRAEVGLPEEAFVFCSFNNNYKITTTMFRVWMRLLASVPNSVLWLLEPKPEAAHNLRTEAVRQGIDPSRIVFAPKQPLSQHLARHPLADLFMDCYPVNAHTTASDALRMGLPLITISGQTFVSRVAGSLLHAIGMPELIMPDLQTYEQTAFRLATDRHALMNLRQRLVENSSRSSLFDIQASTDKIESAYRAMVERHLHSKP